MSAWNKLHVTITIATGLLLACTSLVSGNATAQETDHKKTPLKVYVLVGQSNMQGHAQVRTLPHIGMDPATKPILDAIQDESGKARVFNNIWVSYLSTSGVKTGNLTTGFGADGNKIGPELTFGIHMQKRVAQPILIIKTAWGGKSIHTDFRSPSAGPFTFEDSVLKRMKDQAKDIDAIIAERKKATGVYYRQTIDHVHAVLGDIKSVYPNYDASQGYELSGLVWFQGWNDMVDPGVYPNRGESGGYDNYTKVLTHLIRDFRKDLSAPHLPIVVGVMGVGGPTEKYTAGQKRYVKIHQGFRDAMAASAKEDEFKGNVVNVLTENCWDMELDALIAKDNQIKGELKKSQRNGEIKKSEWQTELAKIRESKFSKQELEILKTGTSNAAYHYLGCSKIMALIGKAFAENMPVADDKK
ncbi:MAG: sialate O-acetylesterase [Mariniblastus sp.]